MDKWTVEIKPRSGLFGIDLKELWKYRDLILLLARRSFVSLYKQTILGPLWAIIQPLLTTGILTVVFGRIVGASTDGAPQFLFYMCGSVPWSFFARCIEKTSQTFVENEKVFSKVYFPRLCAPIASVMVALINYFIQLVFFIICIICHNAFSAEPVHIAWNLIALTPLAVLLMACLGLGCGIAVSALTVRYKDLALLVSFGVSLWMYISPVAYPSSLLAEKYPALSTVFMLNPMAPVIEFFRSAFLGSGTFNPWYLAMSAGVTIVILSLGTLLFNRVQKTFADVI